MVVPSAPLRILFAPDSFKGTIAARDVAAALMDGWGSVRPADELIAVPMADGGEGTLSALAGVFPEARRVPIEVLGPVSEPHLSEWLLIPDLHGVPTGVVELAAGSGITHLREPAPFEAHTVALGQTIAAALTAGVERLLIAVGGSASSDGGSGALGRLGIRGIDELGRSFAPGLAGLAQVDRVVRASHEYDPPRGGAYVLCDVSTPLLGPDGCIRTFGGQKGLGVEDWRRAERDLERWSDALSRMVAGEGRAAPSPSMPGTGAGGGTGFGLAAWGAELLPGAKAIAETVGLPQAVERADIVISGEGRFDAQTAQGKVASEVARLAEARGRRRMLVAGSIGAPATAWHEAVALEELVGREAAMARPAAALRLAGEILAAKAG